MLHHFSLCSVVKKKKRGGVEGWSSGGVVLYINNNDGCRLSIILRIISIAVYFF